MIMNHRRIDDLHTAIKYRASKYINAAKLTLTGDEFIDAFINPEHVEILRKTQGLTGSIGSRYYHSCSYRQDVHGVGRVGLLSLNFQGHAPIIIPNYVESNGVAVTAPEEVVAKIAEFVRERDRVGHMFGLAYAIIDWLAKNCKDMRAARTLFPALTLLMKDAYPNVDSAGYRQAEKLQQASASENLPMLDRERKNKFIEASNLLVATTLLPSEVSHPRDVVIVDFSGFSRDCDVFGGRAEYI